MPYIERPYIGRISRENRHYTETEPKLNRNSTETQYSLHPSFSLATYHPKTPQRIAKNNNKKTIVETSKQQRYGTSKRNNRKPAWPTEQQHNHLPPRRQDVHTSSSHPTATPTVTHATAITRTTESQQCSLARTQGVRARLFRNGQVPIQPLHGHQHAIARALHPKTAVPLRKCPATA